MPYNSGKRSALASAYALDVLQKMKIFLDDERTPPEGWTLVRWPEEVIELLKNEEVTDLSLDHDLGDDDHGTGYDVILWIEEAVATSEYVPPAMKFHSSNSSARVKMEAGIASIQRFLKERTVDKKGSIHGR